MDTCSNLSEMSDIVTNTKWQTMVVSGATRKTKTKVKALFPRRNEIVPSISELDSQYIDCINDAKEIGVD